MNPLRASLALLSCLTIAGWTSAQDPIKWQIEPGDHKLASIVSLPMVGDTIGHRTCGTTETTLIVSRMSVSRKITWTCYQLPELKELCTCPEPLGWSWSSSSVGSRYACSYTGGKLITVDLTTGKELKSVSLQALGKPHVLHDKAVWFPSGDLITLPQLTSVKSHALVSNLTPMEKNEFILINEFGTPKHVWHRDPKQIIVNGIAYDEFLRPSNSYIGSFSFREFTARSIENGYYSGDIKPAGNESPTTLSLVRATSPEVMAKTDSAGLMLEKIEFYPFRHGFFGLTRTHLHVITSMPDRQREELTGDLKANPMLLPPLLTFDGQHHRLQWIGDAAKDKLIFMTTFKTGYQFADGQHELWLDGDNAAFTEQESNRTQLINRIRQLANAPLSAHFEEVLAAYKARNLWWISRYATATKTTFTGVPVELPCILQYTSNSKKYPLSLIVDFPEQTIKQMWQDPPRLVSTASALSGESIEYLQVLSRGEQAQEIAPAPLREQQVDAMPPLPARYADEMRDRFSWASPSHIKLFKIAPLSFLCLFMFLTLTVRLFELFAPIHMVDHGWKAAALLSLAFVCVSLATRFLIDLLMAGDLSGTRELASLRSATIMALQIIAGIALIRPSLVGPTALKIVVFFVAFIGFNLLEFVLVFLMAMGGLL